MSVTSMAMRAWWVMPYEYPFLQGLIVESDGPYGASVGHLAPHPKRPRAGARLIRPTHGRPRGVACRRTPAVAHAPR